MTKKEKDSTERTELGLEPVKTAFEFSAGIVNARRREHVLACERPNHQGSNTKPMRKKMALPQMCMKKTQNKKNKKQQKKKKKQKKFSTLNSYIFIFFL